MIKLDNTNIYVLNVLSELNYFDSQSIPLPHAVHPLEIWNIMIRKPQPLLKAAFWVRDAISSQFGVKKIGGFSGEQSRTVSVGEYLDFFLVEFIDDCSLVLTERDRHLDVMTCISVDGQTASITSSVQIHNWFGRAYMVPVGVAHKGIVKGMLKSVQRELSQQVA